MFTANTNSVQPQLKSAAVTQADTGGNLVDAINVASLPLQNGITVLNALAGAAGGGAGNGGNGAGSLQALPNLLYSQLVAGTLTPESANKAITAAVTTEQTALTNLAATPGKIIATDLAAIQKLAGGSAASSLLPAKQQSNTSALKNTDVKRRGEQDCRRRGHQGLLGRFDDAWPPCREGHRQQPRLQRDQGHQRSLQGLLRRQASRQHGRREGLLEQ